MAFFKKLGIFAAPTLLIAAGAASTTGCDDASVPGADEICGPCGEVSQGALGISGSAQLDGFFAAVSTLNTATVKASAGFELGLGNLEAAFGLAGTGSLSARVDALIASIEAEVSTNASGGLMVNIAPAKCTASVNVTIEAQASCEASANCEVEADPGKVAVECSGSCEGSCEGGCEGDVTCKADAGGVECEGSCEGSCELNVAAKCEGTCHGDCSGSCSAYNGAGECAGACDGNCEGSCELNAAAECSGSCSGSCTAKAPEADCEGSVKCEGSCKGSCSGGCEGEVTAPSASVDCEASADCNAQASAQGSASLECTPPSIEVGFEFSGSVDAQASFTAKLGALKANGALMIESFTKYEALITGKVDGEVAFEVAPIDAVTASLETVIDAGVSGSLIADLPTGRLPCVIPALTDSVSILGKIGTEATATLAAQAKFAAAFSGGFKS